VGEQRITDPEWLIERLSAWFEDDSRLPDEVARRIIARRADIDALADQLASLLDRPVALTLGPTALDADTDARPSTIGDLGSRVEIVVDGPTTSPLELDALMSGAGSSSAIRLELFISHVFPVYVWDAYRESHDGARGEWRYAPVSLRSPDVASIIATVRPALGRAGFRRLGKRLAATALPSCSLVGGSKPPRVFEVLFTTIYRHRLEFSTRGFRTARRAYGNNRDAQGRLSPRLSGTAVEDAAVSWRSWHASDGRIRKRQVDLRWAGGERIGIATDARGRVLALSLNGRSIWIRPATRPGSDAPSSAGD